jgi:thiol-disulfide isomerase/thioredoxin
MKYKRKTFLLPLLLLIGASLLYKYTLSNKVSFDKKETLIKVIIEGINNESVFFILYSLDGDSQQIDTLEFNNGSLIHIINIEKPKIIRVLLKERRSTFRSDFIMFFVEPDEEIIIQGKLNELSIDYDIVKGNKLSKQNAELRKALLPFFERESIIYKEIQENKTLNDISIRNLRKQFDSLRFHVVNNIRIDFAKSNPNYELSAKLLMETDLPEDSLIKYFNLLSDSVKNTFYGKTYEKYVSAWKSIQPGQIAPEFTAETLSKSEFALKNCNGKYVILHFWATSCGYCIEEIPLIKEMHNKYNEDIVFVSIEGTNKKKEWISIVDEFEMNWAQIFNKELNIDILELYGIRVFPEYIIIDKGGRILKKVEEDELVNSINGLF